MFQLSKIKQITAQCVANIEIYSDKKLGYFIWDKFEIFSLQKQSNCLMKLSTIASKPMDISLSSPYISAAIVVSYFLDGHQ